MTVKPVCDYAWVREMTIGQLLDLLDPEEATSESWEEMEKVLAVILKRAANFYGGVDDFIGVFALAIGLCVVKADGIDKDRQQIWLPSWRSSSNSCWTPRGERMGHRHRGAPKGDQGH